MTSSHDASAPSFTVPGMKHEDAAEVIRLLQERLHALNDLALTLKHVHWNVVGPHFIAVHEMIDPQVDAVRAMVDDDRRADRHPRRRRRRAPRARSWPPAAGTTTPSAGPAPRSTSAPSTSSTRASSATTGPR